MLNNIRYFNYFILGTLLFKDSESKSFKCRLKSRLEII